MLISSITSRSSTTILTMLHISPSGFAFLHILAMTSCSCSDILSLRLMRCPQLSFNVYIYSREERDMNATTADHGSTEALPPAGRRR